jgi:protein involved in polysaccharide export with SLBB domain
MQLKTQTDLTARPTRAGLWFLVLLALVGFAAGCAHNPPLATPSVFDAAPYSAETIQIGDVVSATFPGATNLNFSQPIRVDGLLHLDQSRQIPVLDKTANFVKTNLLEIYGADLIVKEVNVVVESAGFPVFISGAVLRPGKVMVSRSVTVLEAIMEAGGYDVNKADLSKVQVVREDKGVQRTFLINLKTVINNPVSSAFHMRPSDVVIVPERFVFF